MKSFKNYYTEVISMHKVGDEIQWNMTSVADYVDVSSLGGMNHGKIVSVAGSMYTVRINNGNEVKIKSEDAIAFGGDDAT